MKQKTLITLLVLTFQLSIKAQKLDWTKYNREATTIDNITYHFNSYIPINERKESIKIVQASVKENLKVLKEKKYTRNINIQFVKSRAEILKLTGTSGQAVAFYDSNTLFMTENKNELAKHELMHMVAYDKWGYGRKNDWLDEGLATYVGGYCFKYTLSEFYKYFLQSEKLIPFELLASKFRSHDDIISYIESAYVVKHLIENYGIEKFELLWKKGFKQIKSIYGFNLIELEKLIKQKIETKHPNEINFNWDIVKKGC